MNTILFRNSLAEENERLIAEKYFNVIDLRTEVKPNETIICRYSALPYYDELEKDVLLQGSKLINSHKQHLYVADLKNWYYDLSDFTPKTWFDLSQVDSDGPFVLKGSTNSRKQLWKSHMFAANKKEMMEVYCRLLDDSLIQHQGIYVRQYEELNNFGRDTITGAPISKEFRCFFYKTKLLAKGFYWSQHSEGIDVGVDEVPDELLNKIAEVVAPNINFWVADVAQKKDGEFILIELNDGQMSGLSCVDPDELYRNLRKAINE